MAKKRSSRKKTKNKVKAHHALRPRGVWKGTISFGLVNIPVYLETAQQEKRIHFRMLDKRDNAPIGYKQINKATKKEVQRTQIVKAYEYEKGRYVLMKDSDFEKANVKATKTLDIEDFVSVDEVDPILFYRPYYIVPQPGGEKSYILLRDVMQKTGKSAVAKIVLHTVQHLALLMAKDDYIVLELLRFADEIKEIHEADFLRPEVKKSHALPREIQVAEQLVQGMSAKWNPEKYKDTYRTDLMGLIEKKLKKGSTVEVEEIEPEESEDLPSNVIDLTELLKKSLNVSSKQAGHRLQKRV